MRGACRVEQMGLPLEGVFSDFRCTQIELGKKQKERLPSPFLVPLCDSPVGALPVTAAAYCAFLCLFSAGWQTLRGVPLSLPSPWERAASIPRPRRVPRSLAPAPGPPWEAEGPASPRLSPSLPAAVDLAGGAAEGAAG